MATKKPAKKTGKKAPAKQLASADKSRIPIVERLLKHLRRLSRDLIEDYEDGLQSGTSEAVADYRETFVKEVLGRFFPRTYRVSKGPIFDSFDGRSQSIDCVVCAPNHPLFLDALGRNTTLLADGVHCAVEVKPDLRDLPGDFGESRKREPEIVRGLNQVRTVKRLQRTAVGLAPVVKHSERLRDYARRVPTHIYAVESAPIDQLAKYIADFYEHRAVPLAEQVDLVVVLNRGVVEVVKYPELGTTKAPGSDEWGPGIVARELAEDALAYFLYRIVSDVPPEMRMSKPVLYRYFKTNDWGKPREAWQAHDG